MAVSLEQFAQHLAHSGLVAAADLAAFLDGLPPAKRPYSAEALAAALVKAGTLTRYQAQCVYQGRIKGLVFGEYRVLDKLGQGAMGVVLKAEHRWMKRVVAVKMIAGATLKSSAAVKRFDREMQAAAQLEHPNIVAAYDAGIHEGAHYLVMQFVQGRDLGALVNEKGPLPIAQALDYVLQAARGLHHAHQHGIIHRDIKPANLLVDDHGTVKILDLGLARVGGPAGAEDKERLTATGQVMGTMDYMAPEQALDTHRVDARADIYALGCTLYRLLTGASVYQGSSIAKILVAHQLAPIPSLSAARPEVPARLDGLFRKMLAKQPADRPASMIEVIGELEACLGGQPQAPPQPRETASRAAAHDDDFSFLAQQTRTSVGGVALAPAPAAVKQADLATEPTVAHHAADGSKTSAP